MRLIITHSGKAQDVSELLISVKTSGECKNISRVLVAAFATSPLSGVPSVVTEIGSVVQLFYKDTLVFEGLLFARERRSDGNELSFTCFDRGIYLKRNFITKRISGQTPEEVAAALCGEFGIAVGSLAQTGISLSRMFFATSIYDIILTLYTLASKKNGKKYRMGFAGSRFVVTELGGEAASLVIKGGSNLISASMRETAEQSVNAVAIYDQNGALIKVVEDKSSIAKLGRLQEAITKTKNDNREQEARKRLGTGGIEQRITVDNLGDLRCVCGGSVIVEEPYTGLCGKFYIESDSHEWKRGQYYNKLTLCYSEPVQEGGAGSEA